MVLRAPRYAHLLFLGVAFGIGLSGGVPAATAQEAQRAPDLTALSLEQLMKIEVQSVFGASHYLQRITEAPSSVTIVTAAEIRRSGYRTLADALAMVRGFYVSGDRQYAFLGVRGFLRPSDYDTRFLLTIDGHRANDNIYGQAYLDEASLVHLDDVERIEVIRGPSSSLYGSHAFFGVINVVTREARRMAGTEASVEVGSFGRVEARVAWGATFHGGALSLSASKTHVDGPRDLYYPAFDDPATNFGVAHGLDAADRAHVRAQLDLGTVSVRGAWNRRTKGIPTGAWGMVFNDPRARIRDTQGYVDAAWERRWSPVVTTSVRAFYDEYHYLGNMPFDGGLPGQPEVVLNVDDATGRWGGAEARASAAWRGHHLTAGFEYRRDFDQSQRNFDIAPAFAWLDDSRRSTTAGFYLQDDLRFTRLLSASIGMRRDVHSRFADPLKPRLALIVTPTPRRTFKLIYGEAFRAPTVFEVWYASPPNKSNPELGPEDVSTAEFAWEEYLGRNYRVGVNAYRYRVKNLVQQVVDPADDMLLYDNVAAAHAEGVEIEGEAVWSAGLRARASYAWQRTHDRDTGGRLTNSPAHLFHGMVSAPLGRPDAFASLALRGVGRRTATDGSRVAAYFVPRLAVTCPAFSSRASVRLVVDNLLNGAYAEPASEEHRQLTLPQDGRTVSLKLSWRFR